MQYRVDFFLGIFISLGLSSLGPIFQYLIFSQTRGYPDWNIKQIVLYQGVLLLWFGIKDMLFGEIRSYIETMIKNGEFDMILLKPYPPIGLILSNGFYFQGIGPIIAGLIIIIFSVRSMFLHISFISIILFLLFFLIGIILYMALTIFYCTITIMLVYMNRLGEIIDKFLRFTNYPVEIFMPFLRIIFIVFFPIAVWVYLPTQALLNRVEIYSFISIIGSIIVFTLSIIMWNFTLKKYTSAGG